MKSILARIIYSVALLALGCWGQTSGTSQQPSNRPNKPQAQEEMVAAKKEVQVNSPLHLSIVETITAKRELAGVFSELNCDEDGNIYLGAENWAGTIKKLNSKGELLATIDRHNNPDVEVYGAGSYTLSPTGELYTWVGSQKDRAFHMLIYGADGQYKSAIKLEGDVRWVPGPFAVFGNGNFLMIGQRYGHDVKQPMTPFTGLYRSDGKLLKQIALEDDERIQDLAKEKEHDSKLTSAAVPTSNPAVALGHAQSAKDGNIYVMRWLSPAVFYVVSPSGEVLRRFTVDPGRSNLMPVTMHISGNRIAVLFRDNGTREQEMKIVDLNGEEIASYDATSPDPQRPLGAAFACYFAKTGRFSFRATDDDHRVLFRIVEPR